MVATHKLMDCNEMIVTHKLLDCNEIIVTQKLLDCNEKIVTHKLLDCNEGIVTHKLLNLIMCGYKCGQWGSLGALLTLLVVETKTIIQNPT